jgi:hypothetical protein
VRLFQKRHSSGSRPPLKLPMRKPPYPIHGRSLGMMGTPREPYTVWDCGHGHTTIGSCWEPPGHECFRCGWDSIHAMSDWQPADLGAARALTVEALDNRPDLIARHDAP